MQSPPPPMIVNVRTATMHDLQITTVNSKSTVDELKDKIEECEGIPKRQQRLIFKGKPMVDTMTMADSGVIPGATTTVHMVMALRAGV